MATSANWTVVFEDKKLLKKILLPTIYQMILFGLILNFQIFGLFSMELQLLLMK